MSEGSGPWLQSASSFLGRHVWEFDPDAGTPEERAEVERLRQDFTRHRFQRKESPTPAGTSVVVLSVFYLTRSCS